MKFIFRTVLLAALLQSFALSISSIPNELTQDANHEDLTNSITQTATLVELKSALLRARSIAAAQFPEDKTDELLASIGQNISKQSDHFIVQEGSSSMVPRPPVEAIQGKSVSARSSTISTASHLVMWDSSTSGCTYTLPNITISCGTGGTITLIEHDPSIQGCVRAANANSMVCSSVKYPYTSPALIVVCSGTTAAQLAATIRLPTSQAKCSAPSTSNPSVKGGSALVVGYLGRYCKDTSGRLYLSSNYKCISGIKDTPSGVCYSKKSCATSSSSSCYSSLGAVSLSDSDSRSTCVNVGPNLTTVPLSIHSVYWGGGSKTCQVSPNKVTITCGNGGSIAVIKPLYPEVSQCTKSGTSTYYCTKKANENLASVDFVCSGRGFGHLDSYAALPVAKVSSCTFSGLNNATQLVLLERYCGTLNNMSAYASRLCGVPSQLIEPPDSAPYCHVVGHCTGSGCSINLSPVLGKDPFVDPICTFLM